MKVIAYNILPFEEASFDFFERTMGISITRVREPLCLENAELSRGHDGVSIIGHSHGSRAVLEKLGQLGIRCISTRTIGYDHIDMEAAQELGITVCNASYAPYNVADFTVMLLLMLLRKAKISICRALVNDFSLNGMQGREIRSLTIGILGTGKIGKTVIHNLSGFGCRILAYDKYESQEIKEYASYADLETIYRECDVISLHMPLNKETYHMINKESIEKMKKGVLLINTARGALIDSEDLIEALEKEWIGGAGIDTLEEEEGVAHVHVGTKIIDKRSLLYLKQFPNVILTQHYAFFTEEAAKAMVESSLLGLKAAWLGEENPYKVHM